MAAKYFTVGSVATFVHHRGPTTLPGQPPAPSGGATVLCVHDVAGNGHVFAGVLDALADRHRPIAFDLPGHGRSGGLDSLGAIAAMAAHTKELADRLDVRAPVLLGDGMGAAVALEAAATWPDWPAAVVVSAGPRRRRPPTRRRSSRCAWSPPAGPAASSTRPATRPTPREVYERAFGEWMKTDPRATVGDLEALAEWDGAAIAGAVTAPVVVVVGEHEPPEAVAAAEALAAAVRHGRVVALAGAGRRGVAEQPEQLAAIVAVAAESRRERAPASVPDLGGNRPGFRDQSRPDPRRCRHDALGRRRHRRRLRAPDPLGAGQDRVPDHGRVAPRAPSTTPA